MIATTENIDNLSQLALADIGNTRVALATWSDGVRSEAEHVNTHPVEPVIDWLQMKWEQFSSKRRRAVMMSSVCPPALKVLKTECKKRGIDPLLVVGENLGLPIGADVPEPNKVGTDRLCAAAAAYERVKGVCVVADFGTALTIDLVADNGVFLGGTILPGMALAARALHEHTAQLPLVEVGAPTEILGKDTASAIRNGIFAMMTGALREITERYATEIGKWPPLILTGNDAPAVAKTCDFVDAVIPDLCLDGLVMAYRQHNLHHDND